MNTYRNKITGVLVVVDSTIGGDWELVSSQSQPKKTAKKETVKKETKEKKENKKKK